MARAPFTFNDQEPQMNFIRTISILGTVVATTMATSVWAASDEKHDSHHPAGSATTKVAQETPATAGMGMGRGG